MNPSDAASLRALALQFAASLTLADHLGDVSESLDKFLREAGVPMAWEDFPDLQRQLAARGVTTLYGTSLRE